MRHYEVMIILDPSLEDRDAKAAVDGYLTTSAVRPRICVRPRDTLLAPHLRLRVSSPLTRPPVRPDGWIAIS
jgi:hypothetical protein